MDSIQQAHLILRVADAVSADSGKQQLMRSTRLVRWIMITAVLLACIVVVAKVWPIGPDYYFTFHRTAEKWVHGETRLYDDNPTTEVPGNPDIGFFYAPWLLIVLVPLVPLSLQLGQAVLTVGSIIGIVVCLRAFSKITPVPVWVLALILVNMHTLDLLLRGNIDAIPLTGTVLGWWAVQSRRPMLLSLAFAMIAIKPPSVVLPAIMLLICIRHWTWAEKVRVISLPIGLVIGSGIVFGIDWPLRFLSYARFVPPNDYLSTSLWRGAAQVGLPVWPIAVLAIVAVAATFILAWRGGMSQWVLALGLVTNLVFAPYVHGNHYVLLIPALAYLARKDWRLALLAYLATWTPLLRLFYGFTAAPIDVIYPVLLFVFLWGIKFREAITANQQAIPTALLTLVATESTDEQMRLRTSTSYR